MADEPNTVASYEDETSQEGISGIAAADRLQGIIERSRGWPIWAADRTGGVDTGTYAQVGSYGKSLREIALWVALRENDREAIIKLTDWEQGRPIHIDNLPGRISGSYRDLLYGEDAQFFAADRSDQDNMDEMVEETGLDDELGSWADTSVSEGEVWWRAWTDTDISQWPLVSGHSRLNVLPLFVGHKIPAIAFIDNVVTQEQRIENEIRVTFFRHIEIHTVGYVRNLLYRGSVGGLGDRIDLSLLPETKDLDEDWFHGLPVMLAGRIPNKLGRDFRVGVSEYQGVRDLLMDLNEARTIMAENARLVLKARMVVPSNAVDANGNFDASKDIITAETLDEEMAGKPGGSYSVLEYNFRAAELIQHKNELVLDIMSRCGLAEQYAQQSRGGEGQSFTGTALRTKLVPTLQSAKTHAKPWDRNVPTVLQALALLSALDTDKGGCGQSWTNANGPHTQKRANLLPEDPNEKVQRHVMAVQGEVESVQTAVEDMRDDEWSEEEIALEVARIRADRSVGPTYTKPGTNPDSLAIPNVPPGGPGSRVPTPNDLLGSEQPGTGGRPAVDGQSPGTEPPRVTAGGTQ